MSLYHRANVIKVEQFNPIDTEETFTGFNSRNKVKLRLDTDKKLIGIELNKHKKNSFDSIIEYNDVIFTYLKYKKINKYFPNIVSPKNRYILIDKTFNLLVIFKKYKDMLNYISGNKYNYVFGTTLDVFKNSSLLFPKFKTSLISRKKGKTYEYFHYLISNNYNDNFKYQSRHFDPKLKVNRICKFASSNIIQLKILKETIEHTVGHRIIYN